MLRLTVDNGTQTLAIAEIFYSVQGEGTHVGRAAVFVRLAGCNLSCTFCDTDYSMRELLTINEVLARIEALDTSGAFIILTGGEPLIQAATPLLIEALLARGRGVHIESNGTVNVDLPPAVWLTVSPKERTDPKMALRANEAKLIVDRRIPTEHCALFREGSIPMFLQPESNLPSNIELALAAILAEPTRFRLSLQTHKYIGVR